MRPQECNSGQSLAKLQEARLVVADLMTRHNRPQFAPILERLTVEIEAAARQSAALDKARQILAEANR